jgi:hypothetical protein
MRSREIDNDVSVTLIDGEHIAFIPKSLDAIKSRKDRGRSDRDKMSWTKPRGAAV